MVGLVLRLFFGSLLSQRLDALKFAPLHSRILLVLSHRRLPVLIRSPAINLMDIVLRALADGLIAIPQVIIKLQYLVDAVGSSIELAV